MTKTIKITISEPKERKKRKKRSVIADDFGFDNVLR